MGSVFDRMGGRPPLRPFLRAAAAFATEVFRPPIRPRGAPHPSGLVSQPAPPAPHVTRTASGGIEVMSRNAALKRIFDIDPAKDAR